MSFYENLQKILVRFKEIEEKLADPEISRENYILYSKEFSDNGKLIEKIHEFNKIIHELNGINELLQDKTIDNEIKEIAQNEQKSLEDQLSKKEYEIKILLLPKDKDDEKNAILEVRAGTGGEEAALFAASLFRMYQRYAENKGWKFEVLSITDTGIGGYKDASAIISGREVFAHLKYESGVHRVQRVPETESSGRVHTSAATVAVLPEVEDIDIVIEEKDLRIDVYRSSGPGGQSVNTTDSAVRIVHIPTGITVCQQDEKSQHKNRTKAMKILRARLYDEERLKNEKERAATRKSQVGSGDRSERIRTYNFPQGRVTDHRINLTLYRIEAIQNGEIDEFIDALITEDETNKLSESI